jgi:hypothetical protein
MSALTMYADVIFIVFIAGTLVGAFLIVCWASNTEDKRYSLKKDPPGNACGGARRIVGFGRRPEGQGRSFRRPSRQRGQGRGRNQ